MGRVRMEKDKWVSEGNGYEEEKIEKWKGKGKGEGMDMNGREGNMKIEREEGNERE